MELYIVERRKANFETEDAVCFVGSELSKSVKWIRDNTHDFDSRDFNWHWAILKATVDSDDAELVARLDKNGVDLQYNEEISI